jgi:hypothetical protein
VLAAFGVRRDRRDGTWVVPSETTIRRTLGGIDADALDAQVGAWLLAVAGYGADEDAAGDQMVIAVDGKTARGAKDKDGAAPHLLAAITCDEVAAIAQQQVSAKSNEIPAFAPLLRDLDLDGAVILADALHTQREHARFIVQDKHADYLFTVEHASHCSCCWSWRVKESSLAVSGLDTEPFAASAGEVDGVELAALDLVQHGLAGDAEPGGGLTEGQPAVRGLGPDPVAELLVDADLPGGSRGELLAGDEAVA